MAYSRFRPTGTLDITTDPQILPAESDGKNMVSGAMTRCKNLRLDRDGIAETRYGSTRLANTFTGTARRIAENAGFRYVFADNKIFKDEAPIGTGYNNDVWSVAKYKQFTDDNVSLFATNGTDKVRIESGTVYEWGIDAPTVAPVLTPTGTGTTYDVCYTYAIYDGTTLIAESNPSPSTSTSADTAISVAWTDSANTEVTHVRIYMSNAGGGVMYFSEAALAGSSPESIDTAAALGDAAPDTHDRLPDNVTCLGGPFNGFLFAAVGHKLYFSKSEQPYYWPLTYYVECGQPQFPIKSIQIWSGNVYAITTREIYQIIGTSADSFVPYAQKAKTGCLSEDTAEPVAGFGIFHQSNDGIYLFDGNNDEKITERAFGNIWTGGGEGAVPYIESTNAANSWLLHHKDRLYFAYPSTGSTYPDAMLVMKTQSNGKVMFYEYPVTFSASCVDYENDRLLATDLSGYVWVFEDTTATADNGTAVSWEVQSKEFSDALRRYFPRWAKYDVEVTGTATGKILLDGSVHQSHTLSTRSVQKRLVASGNGKRLAIRIIGSGVVAIHAAEVE